MGFSIFAAVFFLIGFLLWKKENRKTLGAFITTSNRLTVDNIIGSEKKAFSFVIIPLFQLFIEPHRVKFRMC